MLAPMCQECGHTLWLYDGFPEEGQDHALNSAAIQGLRNDSNLIPSRNRLYVLGENASIYGR